MLTLRFFLGNNHDVYSTRRPIRRRPSLLRKQHCDDSRKTSFLRKNILHFRDKKAPFLFKSTQGRFPSANPSKCVISRTKTNIIGHPPFWLTESTNHIPASHPSPNIDFFVWCLKVHRSTKFLITAQGRCYKWLQTFDFYGAQSSFVNYFKNDSSRSI